MFPGPFRQTTGKVRILIADGDAGSRARYCAAVLGAGWEVFEADEGRDALVKALIHRPTLVVSAVDLPLIDGLTLCDIIRRDRIAAPMPVLVLTNDTQPAQLARAREAGADLVLDKGIAPEELIEHVRQLIARRPGASPTASGHPPARQGHVWSKRPKPVAPTAPPTPPPSLVCPVCRVRLVYEETHIGGVRHRDPERWDYFMCARCGRFQYRHRTRKLRHL